MIYLYINAYCNTSVYYGTNQTCIKIIIFTNLNTLFLLAEQQQKWTPISKICSKSGTRGL